MRQLVTIRTVKELRPIEGADRIELAIIDGWQCVVKKGDFEVGSQGVYYEIDSMLPTIDARFAFLAKGKQIPYARVRTMRLKKTLSQGLLMPLKQFPELDNMPQDSFCDLLDVRLYEPPVPIAGKQKGTFPLHLVPKTDQERIQNMPRALEGKKFLDFEVTEKLDGTSCTIWFFRTNEIVVTDVNHCVGVASRNWEMQKDDENVYSKALRDNDLPAKLIHLQRNIAIQGEVVGPGIQGNKYGLTQQEFYVFNMYDIDTKKYLTPEACFYLAGRLGLKHVPILNLYTTFANVPSMQPIQQGDDNCGLTLDLVLAGADGKSALNPAVMREGLVFKALDGSTNFKAISNEWLLKYE